MILKQRVIIISREKADDLDERKNVVKISRLKFSARLCLSCYCRFKMPGSACAAQIICTEKE